MSKDFLDLTVDPAQVITNESQVPICNPEMEERSNDRRRRREGDDAWWYCCIANENYPDHTKEQAGANTDTGCCDCGGGEDMCCDCDSGGGDADCGGADGC